MFMISASDINKDREIPSVLTLRTGWTREAVLPASTFFMGRLDWAEYQPQVVFTNNPEKPLHHPHTAKLTFIVKDYWMDRSGKIIKAFWEEV